MRRLTSGTGMRKNFSLRLSRDDCLHTETCGCSLIVEGVSARTMGMKFESTEGTLTEKYVKAKVYINTYDFDARCQSPLPKIQDEAFFRASVPEDSTMFPCDPIIEGEPRWPQPIVLASLHPAVLNALKRADFRYMKYRYPHMHISWSMMKLIWGESVEIPTLVAMCMRRESMFHWACGTTNGYPHVVAAMANLYPQKLARAILSMSRSHLGDAPKAAFAHLNEAMDLLYRKMRVDLTKKDTYKLSLAVLKDMYMGASNGRSNGKKFEIKPTVEHPEPIKVSPNGKKIDTFEQEVEAILEYLRTGKEPNIPWVVPPKDENFVGFDKQATDEKWAQWREKLRVFNIPCSIYILMERLVSHIRMFRERGWVIRIGHRWSHGGADTIAQCLGVTVETAWIDQMCEGDAKLYDQTVVEQWVNLYWSSMSNFVDPESEDFPVFEQIVKFLLKNMIVRITQLFGSIWGFVKGGVPSGAYNTSHMDSWVMAMYFMLFAVYQLRTAPEEEQEQLEMELLTIIMIIVYGDDHLYNKGTGKGSIYFSATNFKHFMKKHFNVEMRDVKDGIPFCSKVKDGWIINWGATFLKHQFIVNPEKGAPGQPNFLPFRESREYLVRAVWGRVTRPRDCIDTMLSIIGHAYGTYASNRDAYDRLCMFYAELLSESGAAGNLAQVMRERMTLDDLKKIRQMGLTEEEVVSGFPSWYTLVQKNIVDDSYQNIAGRDPESVLDLDDCSWN